MRTQLRNPPLAALRRGSLESVACAPAQCSPRVPLTWIDGPAFLPELGVVSLKSECGEGVVCVLCCDLLDILDTRNGVSEQINDGSSSVWCCWW